MRCFSKLLFAFSRVFHEKLLCQGLEGLLGFWYGGSEVKRV